MTEKRLLGIERKMKTNFGFANKYKMEMEKYMKKGYAKKILSTKIETKIEKVWYLLHIAVQTIHKPDKLRIVFEAAALLKGPDQAKPLITMLSYFQLVHRAVPNILKINNIFERSIQMQ